MKNNENSYNKADCQQDAQHVTRDADGQRIEEDALSNLAKIHAAVILVKTLAGVYKSIIKIDLNIMI